MYSIDAHTTYTDKVQKIVIMKEVIMTQIHVVKIKKMTSIRLLNVVLIKKWRKNIKNVDSAEEE